MVVVYNTMGREALNNVITFLNFPVERAVFVGYSGVVQEKRKSVENFLRKYCGVKEVVFLVVSESNIDSMINVIKKDIDEQKALGNDIYFDITGGESLVHVAFGMLSKEYNIPIHIFGVRKNEFIEVEGSERVQISKKIERRKVTIDLDKYIEMRGGKINYNLHKGFKSVPNDEFAQDVIHISRVALKHSAEWNNFTQRLQEISDDDLQVNKTANAVLNKLKNKKKKDTDKDTWKMTPKAFNAVLKDLNKEGILVSMNISNGKYYFNFKSEEVKRVLMDGGSYLELLTYIYEKQRGTDAKIGAHIDWDGEIHAQTGIDVVNEIDVISINNYIPTFISCKSGNLSSTEAQEALFELESVTAKFGGKYAKRVLAIANDITYVVERRAKEIGIVIRRYNLENGIEAMED